VYLWQDKRQVKGDIKRMETDLREISHGTLDKEKRRKTRMIG
jgi:hypothetical protein